MNYPVVDAKQKINKRLIEILDKPYRILFDANLHSDWMKNEWNLQSQVAHGLMTVAMAKQSDVYLLPYGPHSICINERNGYIAQMIVGHLVVYKPQSSNSIALVAQVNLATLTLKQGLVTFNKVDCDLSHIIPGRRDVRVRYVGQNIYVFNPNSYRIHHFALDEAENKIDFVQTLYDPYFTESKIKDVLVTDELLIILFDRWLGIYKLYPFEWYHAISFSKNEHLRVHSLEMSHFDDCEDDKEDKIEIDDADDDEEKQVVEEAVYASSIGSKASIKNYIFINAENSVIAIHPVNPTFDYLNVANNVQGGASYCVSKKYGMLWIGNDGLRIMQSSKFGDTNEHVVFEITNYDVNNAGYKWNNFDMMKLYNDPSSLLFLQKIAKFESIRYDEGYGISGRLLVVCQSLSQETALYQFFNQDELLPLKQELERIEYQLMPGTNEKPFNLIVFVYEMLYGTDYIDALVKSADFNSVYALPGIEEEKEAKEEEEMDKVRINDFIEKGSNVIIYSNSDNRWHEGLVIRVISFGDLVEVSFGDFANERMVVESKETLSRYSNRLLYAEELTNLQLLEHDSKQLKEGDKCIYYYALMKEGD